MTNTAKNITGVYLLVCAAMATASIPLPSAAESCNYWVATSPAGSDSNPGTINEPWATIEHAASSVEDNFCTVWLKDGTYTGDFSLNERYTTYTTFQAQHPYKAILQNNGVVLSLTGARNIAFDGFEIRHNGPGASVLVIQVHRSGEMWSEDIVFRNNIIHDSYNNDLLKIYNGARNIIVEGNVFYNQGESEEHMDVNSVTDVTIRDNIFFNDFTGSGRTNANSTKHFIVIKDSNGDSDGLEGSERVTVRRNIFLNWEGGKEKYLKVGADGKPYHEAEDISIENNLMIGNMLNIVDSPFGISGAKNVTFNNNTVVGDMPSSGYAFRVDIKEDNPLNEDIFFFNNIWSDPTGTMGSGLSEDNDEFSNGDPNQTINLILDNNLYWNGGDVIPSGDLISPLIDDNHRLVSDPMLNSDQASIVLPRWNGSTFLSGNETIREEFLRLVALYGRIRSNSPAVGMANPSFAPADDILGHLRPPFPSMGAYEGSAEEVKLVFLPLLTKGSP
ncbi:MAG: hypothetical protein KAJ19_25660 [Gammaproteobacteria bacterium]|nr:hypothetical protein [Gammaproteobacteria bacterium]